MLPNTHFSVFLIGHRGGAPCVALSMTLLDRPSGRPDQGVIGCLARGAAQAALLPLAFPRGDRRISVGPFSVALKRDMNAQSSQPVGIRGYGFDEGRHQSLWPFAMPVPNVTIFCFSRGTREEMLDPLVAFLRALGPFWRPLGGQRRAIGSA